MAKTDPLDALREKARAATSRPKREFVSTNTPLDAGHKGMDRKDLPPGERKVVAGDVSAIKPPAEEAAPAAAEVPAGYAAHKGGGGWEYGVKGEGPEAQIIVTRDPRDAARSPFGVKQGSTAHTAILRELFGEQDDSYKSALTQARGVPQQGTIEEDAARAFAEEDAAKATGDAAAGAYADLAAQGQAPVDIPETPARFGGPGAAVRESKEQEPQSKRAMGLANIFEPDAVDIPETPERFRGPDYSPPLQPGDGTVVPGEAEMAMPLPGKYAPQRDPYIEAQIQSLMENVPDLPEPVRATVEDYLREHPEFGAELAAKSQASNA